MKGTVIAAWLDVRSKPLRTIVATAGMIAAIIEHPNGPHFVKAVGPVNTIEHWRESIITYLKSSRLEE